MPEADPQAMAALKRTAVVVPAYNEAGQIRDTVLRLLAWPVTVVVVDDGSRDGTADAVLDLPIVVLRHAVNLGQGAALRTGIDYALRSRARFIVTFDADGQHDEHALPAMVGELEQGAVDVVLGSRFLGSSPGMPRSRRWLLRLATVFTRVTTGLPFTDAHNGLRAFTAEAARALALSQNRMAHASEVLDRIGRERLRWKEIPTTVRYTPYSRAKGQNGLGAVNIVYDLIMRRWFS